MLIGTLPQAVAAIRCMSKNEIIALTAELEKEFPGLHCADRRRKRDFCSRTVILEWDICRWDIVRCIYNALDD